MKRIHLFEFEDQSWFPTYLRNSITNLLKLLHRLFKTSDILSDLLTKKLHELELRQIFDLCSGSGGPLPGVLTNINESQEKVSYQLILSDLYPNKKLIAEYSKSQNIHYHESAVNVTELPLIQDSLLTMICSFHHLKPSDAVNLLKEVQRQKLPIFIYELSDNSAPKWLWWTAIPVNIIMCWLITPFVRPLSLLQLFFTYLIPIVPICYAWDGAVSNIRTYDDEDFNELLILTDSENYQWEFGKIDNKMKSLFIYGKPL